MVFMHDNGIALFQNKGHLDNFGKYLFSMSFKHQENDKTKLNYCTNGKSGTFLSDPKKTHKGFKKKIENYDSSSLSNTLVYFEFALIIEGKLISNFIDENTTVSLMQETMDREFDSESDLINKITGLIRESEAIVSWSKCPTEYRKAVEKHLHALVLSQTENVLATVSHNDQEGLYHIHAIVEN